MTLETRQDIHRQIMQAICEVIHDEDKPLVLKGGTALLFGYGLQRFSENLDFDLTTPLQGHLNIENICKSAIAKLAKKGLKVGLAQFHEPKKTDTTHRCRPMFSVGADEPNLPIKIEISSRSMPDPAHIQHINGIAVYHISEIARLKLLAASEDKSKPYRTTARDLHDLAFIASRWTNELHPDITHQLKAFFSEPAYLMERYASAYQDDPILNGRLFDDLSIIECWLAEHNDDDALSIFTPN